MTRLCFRLGRSNVSRNIDFIRIALQFAVKRHFGEPFQLRVKNSIPVVVRSHVDGDTIKREEVIVLRAVCFVDDVKVVRELQSLRNDVVFQVKSSIISWENSASEGRVFGVHTRQGRRICWSLSFEQKVKFRVGFVNDLLSIKS